MWPVIQSGIDQLHPTGGLLIVDLRRVFASSDRPGRQSMGRPSTEDEYLQKRSNVRGNLQCGLARSADSLNLGAVGVSTLTRAGVTGES